MIAGTTRRKVALALLFLAPNLIGFLVFTLGPVLISLGGSFTNWSLEPSIPVKFIGLENYFYLFHDRNFYFYLYNTIYLMLALPFAIAGSLLLAVYLNQKLQLSGPRRNVKFAVINGVVVVGVALVLGLTGSPNLACIVGTLGLIASIGLYFGSIGYRTFFYLPSFTAGVSTTLLWMQLYNPNFGFINRAIVDMGNLVGWHIDPPGWLGSTRSLLGFLPWPAYFNNGGFGIGAREAMMLMGFWSGIGGNTMLLYLAGLASIPPELYEAADVDGANSWQRFWHITLPQLAPTTFFVVVMGIIGGLQGGFEQARVMTNGGPAGITTTLSYYIYTQGFMRLDLGYGSAIAWVLFVFIMGITLLNWRYGNRSADG